MAIVAAMSHSASVVATTSAKRQMNEHFVWENICVVENGVAKDTKKIWPETMMVSKCRRVFHNICSKDHGLIARSRSNYRMR